MKCPWIAAFLIGCGGVSSPELLLDPEPGVEEPGYGERGPFGAAVVEARAQARVSDAVPLDIVYPSNAEGVSARANAPVVVFIHGGLVAPDRYHWLPAYLATRGWVSVLPQADQLLAIAEPGNGAVALERLRELSETSDELDGIVAPNGPVITMGHSLGGVMAARQFAEDPSIDGLVMLASFPAAGDPIEDAVPRPVLALTGTTDVFEFERLENELDRFAGDTFDARIDGMNHYAWTDDATDAELDSDGEQRRAIPATRTDAQRVLDAWLDVHLFEADEAVLDGPFPGVEVQ